ncbi:phytanoyl-CoA dioxygenase family protein [Undibacterium sp. TS12]|nr:phytanoyl-CoA dioxygenase family protein [Undibacterium sp. TS12]MCH8617781.1 phytanoyl-CoA dioxygenase family protein [Undibacterium sp. TS12]
MTMLSTQQLQEFAEQGFLVLRQQASPAFCQEVLQFTEQQLAAHAQPIEYEADTRYPGAPASREAEGGLTARRLLQAYARDARLAQWATGKVLAEPLLQLLGQGACLSQAHHNCIMTKQPQYSTATGWHRDSRYWNFQKAELVSAWLALRNETLENGCLLVIPASHKLDIDAGQLDQAQFLRSDLPQNQGLLAQAVPVPLQQGDVLLFHSNLFHAAGKNQTAATKFSMVFTYRAADNPARPGTRSAAYPEIAL